MARINMSKTSVRKGFLSVFFVGIMLMIDCFAQSSGYNPWNIDDSDTLRLDTPDGGDSGRIPGTIFKAIDPRYIFNIYGFTKSEVAIIGREENFAEKTFGLITFEHSFIPNYEGTSFINTLNVPKKWNYFINDNILSHYQRVLVSSLMLQAIEKIDFHPSDTLRGLLAWLPFGGNHEYRSVDGSIHVYTRDISKCIIDDSTTLFLLNDNQVITRKIFESIKPVYIRSLKRITKKSEISSYKQNKDLNEIVKVELFDNVFLKKNLINPKEEKIISFDGCVECQIYMIDNIQIDENTYQALNRYFFKEVYVISETHKDFSLYSDRFPKKKLPATKKVISIKL